MNKLEKKEAFIHPTGINSTRDRNNDSSKPVSRHFNSFDHSLSDFIVFGLSLVSGDNDCRKTKEMRLIHRLGTINPNGMNKRFSFTPTKD